jgi:hypothetical protein
MKKLIFLFALVISSLTYKAQTVNPCSVSTPTCWSFGNSDNEKIVKTILAASNSGTSAVSTTSISITNTICGVGSFSVTAGAVKLEFLTNAAFTGSINGISWPANLYVPFGNYQARTMPIWTWTVSTGSVTVIQTR